MLFPLNVFDHARPECLGVGFVLGPSQVDLHDARLYLLLRDTPLLHVGSRLFFNCLFDDGFCTAKSDCILDQLRLDHLIDFAVDGQRWRHIDLEQPRLSELVNDYIEPQELKTGLHVGNFGAVVHAGQHNDLLDFDPHLLPVGALGPKLVVQLFVAPLEARSVGRPSGDALGVLVDRAVRQMRVLVAQPAAVIPVRRKPDNALLVEVQLHGPHLADKHVNADVPLDAADKHRLLDVLLDDRLLVVLQLSHVVDQSNAPSSGQISRLANPNLLFFVLR